MVAEGERKVKRKAGVPSRSDRNKSVKVRETRTRVCKRRGFHERWRLY